jgi:hypothetical protein
MGEDSDNSITPLRTRTTGSPIKGGTSKQKFTKEPVARDGFEPSIYGL